MTVKRKLSKSEWEILADPVKGLYKVDGDSYILDFEDKAFETLKDENAVLKAEKAKGDAEEAARIAAAEERGRKKAEEEYKQAKADKNVEAIEASWTKKYGELEVKLKAAEDAHQVFARKAMIDSAVVEMANRISTTPELIYPHIERRLDLDFSGAEPKLFVKDESGLRSALTLQELEKSFVDNSKFATIIKQNGAGSGATVPPNSQTTPPSGASGVQEPKPAINLLTASYAEAKAAGQI